MRKYITLILFFISLVLIRKLTLSYFMFYNKVNYDFYSAIEQYSLYFIFVMTIVFYFVYKKYRGN